MRTPEEQRNYQRAWMARRRQEWIESKGGICDRCGTTENLEVGHIDPSLKTMQPSGLWSRSLAVREKELENCQVLCSECHKKKTISETVWNHGRTGYSKGCRCEVCYEAQRVHNAQRYLPQ